MSSYWDIDVRTVCTPKGEEVTGCVESHNEEICKSIRLCIKYYQVIKSRSTAMFSTDQETESCIYEYNDRT